MDQAEKNELAARVLEAVLEASKGAHWGGKEFNPAEFERRLRIEIDTLRKTPSTT
jgi:hypothetical protein